MRQVEVAALNGAALDWAVATVESLPIRKDPMGFKGGSEAGFWVWDDHYPPKIDYQLIGREYSPSTQWAQGGSLLEKYDIYPMRRTDSAASGDEPFQAGIACCMYGETPLIAAMRALVASQMGHEILIPDTLAA